MKRNEEGKDIPFPKERKDQVKRRAMKKGTIHGN